MDRTPRTSSSQRARTRVLAVAAATAAVAWAGLVAVPAHATPSTDLVISEVYGGGGNSGSTYTNDFVELQNRGAASVDVTGWSVQYHAKGATGTWQTTPLTGSVAPGAYYLVQESQGAGGTTALPTPDATGSIAMSATDGTVALVDMATALSCSDSASCQSASIDLVGYGAAALNETSAAPTLSAATSAQRTSAADSDDNATDFTAAAPTPDAANADSGDGGGTGTGGTPPTPGDVRIHDIQGDSWISPLNDQTVTNVPGIVTGIRTDGTKGYWVQDPNPDSDPATSEGVFVYTTATSSVAVGDSVLFSGTVKDYYPLASGESVSTTSNLSVTEIEDSSVYVLSHDNPLPAPIVLSSTTVPDLYAPDLGGASIESTPITPTRSALDFYESIEGMRAEVDDARVVGPSDSYGEQYVTTKPDQDASYRGGTLLTAENATPSGRLEVVPADGSNPEVSVGDEFAGATVGPIDYSLYGGYLIAATQLGSVVAGGLAPVQATPQASDQLSVATYNVENLAPSDPDSKYQALGEGVVTNLASPDVIAVEEVQDDDGETDDGVVDATDTLTKLTAAIVAAGGPQYSWQEIDPVDDQDGGAPGGNIRVVFLYNPSRVTFDTAGAADVDRSTTGTAVQDVDGTPQLTLSPGRIDPTSDAWDASRKPLVGEFTFQGKPVFVVANHFDAKLGDQNQDGRFQYPAQSSAAQRQQQATEVNSFVNSILDVDQKAAVVVVGDLNDYQFSPALQTLTGQASGHQVLADLITTLLANQQYTYDYDGLSEVLDHILVTAGAGQAKYQVVHINSEFANQTSDHDPQLVQLTPGSSTGGGTPGKPGHPGKPGKPTHPGKPGHPGNPAHPGKPGTSTAAICSPSVTATGYSDALNKLVYHGTELGGLSSLAWDAGQQAWVSAVDNNADDPSRLWSFRDLSDPKVTHAPLVLKNAKGVAYTGQTADNEGLGVLPNGDYVVSSETEPSIRVYNRSGIQLASLPVPARFAVTGTTAAGEATSNATLEGLTVTPDGKTIIAAMEGALSGDVSASGDANAHRLLVYTQGRHGAWTLEKQIEYRTDDGMRIPEITAYSNDAIVVEEASWTADAGNAVNLFAVTGLNTAKDVSKVADLGNASASLAVKKTHLADLVDCPSLGATALETQTNPLLDNFEGMTITGHEKNGRYGLSLISDDNFSATQRTRILNLEVKLP